MKKLNTLIIIIAFSLITACSSSDKKQDLFIGDEIIIRTDGKNTMVAIDKLSLDTLITVALAKDKDRYNALILTNKIFSLEDGTKGKITNYDSGAFEVKITDGKFKDKYIWVDAKWVSGT